MLGTLQLQLQLQFHALAHETGLCPEQDIPCQLAVVIRRAVYLEVRVKVAQEEDRKSLDGMLLLRSTDLGPLEGAIEVDCVD